MIQKKVSLLSVRALFLSLILLPLCGLSANSPAKKNFAIVFESAPQSLHGPIRFLRRGNMRRPSRYRQQVWQQRRASPELLLKMAYAQQQLGHYPAALLYLSMAQARQPRVSTWRQLAALAAQHRLVGYPSTWQQELRVQAQRYYYPGLQAAAGRRGGGRHLAAVAPEPAQGAGWPTRPMWRCWAAYLHACGPSPRGWWPGRRRADGRARRRRRVAEHGCRGRPAAGAGPPGHLVPGAVAAARWLLCAPPTCWWWNSCHC